MPQEFKTLGEFFQPERLLQYELMIAPQREKMELQKNEQVLEAQRNVLAITKQRSEAALGALKEAYDRAPSSEVRLGIMNQWLKTGGVPIQLDRNDYEADGDLFTTLMTNDPGTPEYDNASKQLFVRNPKLQEQADKQARTASANRGFRRLGAAVGLADLAETGEAIAASPQLQSKVAEARVVDPVLQDLQDRGVALKNNIARLNVEGQGLVQPAERATLLLSHAAPVASKLADVEAMTSPDARSAARKLLEQDDPAVVKFTKALPQLTEAAGKTIAQLEQQQIQLSGALKLSKTGRPLPPGETRESLEAKVAVNHQLLGLTMAEQAFYEHPTKSTLKSWRKAADGVNARVSEITTESEQLKQERDSVFEQTTGVKRGDKLAQTELEARFMRYIAGAKMEAAAAADKALSEVRTAYPNAVLDTTKLKDPGKAGITISTNKTAADEYIQSTRATYDQLKNAPAALRSIENAKKLIPGAKGFMGPYGDSLMETAKFLNNRLGTQIDTAGIKDAEELRSRIFFNVMDNLKKLDASPSEMQQRIMMDALGKLGTDPNALPSVLDAYADSIRDKVDVYNTEVRGAEGRGTKFPFDPVIKIPERKGQSDASEKHSEIPTIKSDADFNALPSGAVFLAPDGKKRRKP